MNTQQRGFLTDITNHPDDNTPRLVYADWLEDHNQPARAYFIRWQILDTIEHWQSQNQITQATATDPWASFTWPDSPHNLIDHLQFPGTYSWSWKRGFLTSLRCPLASWIAHGSTLLQLHPISHVYLSDKEPREEPNLSFNGPPHFWYWSCYSHRNTFRPGHAPRHSLPKKLFELVVPNDQTTFGTRQNALNALSAGLIAFTYNPHARKFRLPAWIPCPCCDNFWCTIHQKHAFECICPPAEEWKRSPYQKRSKRS